MILLPYLWMMKNVANETGEQAVNMNEPTERALQARTNGCKNFVRYCPFYRQINYQDSARIHQFHSKDIMRPLGAPLGMKTG